MIEAKAQFDAMERAVHIRVGGLDGKLYLDLCDDRWRAVEIDATGWRVIDNPPVRFRRATGMQALPEPLSGRISGGAAHPSSTSAPIPTSCSVVAWALVVPAQSRSLSGDRGLWRTGIGEVHVFGGVTRRFSIQIPLHLRALPREDRDLFIAANNGHVLAFDNVSGLRAWISDTLCRIATGAGFAVRQLYSDQDEVLSLPPGR